MGLYFSEGDKEQLIREVSIMDVINELHLETRKYGASISILCPSPNHNDRHYGSCKINSRGKCICYACNRSFSALDLLMLEGGMSFYEAMCKLAELSGHPQDFEQKNKDIASVKPKPIRKLTNEQKKLLGFAEYSNSRAYIGYSYERPEAESVRDEEGNYILVNGLGYNPWRTLSMEDPELMEWMVRNKCMERLISIKNLGNRIVDISKSDCSQEMQNFCSELISCLKDIYNEIMQIYISYGGIKTKIGDMERIITRINTFFSPLTKAA